jgi:threonine/homoserine/homoserine lactone efflux protein
MPSGLPALLSQGPKNLSLGERAAYIAAGLGLAASAARPRPNPLLNVLALAAGSYLAWTGAQGRCPVKRLLVDNRKQVTGPEA